MDNQEIEDFEGIVIDHLEFARVILKISGHITENVGKLSGATITLEDYAVGKMTPAHLEIDEEKRTFSLRYHMLGADHLYPMPTGDYYLALRVNGKKYYAHVCDSLHYLNKNGRIVFPYPEDQDINWLPDWSNDNNYSMWVRRGRGSVTALSMLDLDNDEYYLQVKTVLPPPPDGLRASLKKKINKMINSFKPLGLRMLQKYFAHCVKRYHPGDRINLLFASSSRAELGGNEETIYNRLVERGLIDRFNCSFNFTASINDKRGPVSSLKLTKQLATNDIILIDDYFPFVYRFEYPKRVKFVQVWHACGAFKSLGFERMGKPGAPSINTRVHKCYTHMPVSSPHSALHHAEGFGLPESVFLPIGIPRTDIFFDEAYKKEISEKIYNEYSVLKKRDRIYLYAPTFRGENAKNAYFPMEMVDLERWGSFCKEHNAELLIKMHPFVSQSLGIPEQYKDYILDMSSYREVNDILFITDVLITDYSSIIYEFSLLRRPMYFYAFDQRMYESRRDFYEPYADIVPGEICKTFKGLLRALEKDQFDYAVLDAFVKKNFTYTDGKSTDRFIDQILLS